MEAHAQLQKPRSSVWYSKRTSISLYTIVTDDVHREIQNKGRGYFKNVQFKYTFWKFTSYLVHKSDQHMKWLLEVKTSLPYTDVLYVNIFNLFPNQKKIQLKNNEINC